MSSTSPSDSNSLSMPRTEQMVRNVSILSFRPPGMSIDVDQGRLTNVYTSVIGEMLTIPGAGQ